MTVRTSTNSALDVVHVEARAAEPAGAAELAAVAAAEAIASAAAADIASEAATTAEAMVVAATAAAEHAARRARQTACAAAEATAQTASAIADEAALTAQSMVSAASAAAARAVIVASRTTPETNAAQTAADIAEEAAITAEAMLVAAAAAAARAAGQATQTATAAAEIAARAAADVAAEAAATAEAMVTAATAAATKASIRAKRHAAQEFAGPGALCAPAVPAALQRTEWAVTLADPVLPLLISDRSHAEASDRSPAERGLWRDIALARRMTAQLRKTEALFEAAFHSAPTAMMVTVGPGEVGPMVNRALCDLSGQEPWQLAELGFAKLVHDARRARGERPTAALGSGEVIVTRWRHADGHDMWLRITITELDMSVPGVVCEIVDVTSLLDGSSDAGAGALGPWLAEMARQTRARDRLSADVHRRPSRHQPAGPVELPPTVDSLLARADERDLAAEARDREAEARDVAADLRSGAAPAAWHDDAGTDRVRSSVDREHAARDRDGSAGDRADLITPPASQDSRWLP